MAKKEVTLKSMQWKMYLLGLFKIPLLHFCSPKLLHIDADKIQLRIKLRRRTKNHLNSMYFGALAVGADVAGGLQAFYFAEQEGKKISFAFKGMNAQFLKRAETDVIFECTQGAKVKAALDKSIQTGERVNESVEVVALNTSGEAVATFEMIISLKIIN
jgi:acyl-coenzyme A thioesterase PaaI-like protein